jgi:excisionase family DNA binding protein
MEDAGGMPEDYLSTQHMGWLLGVSPNAVRRMIREGQVEGVRLPGGYRIRREEALRVSRQHLEREAGRQVSARELDRLVDEVIARNQQATGETV